MVLDWTLNVGHLLTIFGGVVAAIAFWRGVDRRLMQIELRTRLIWGWFKREHGINGDVSPGDICEDEVDRNFSAYARGAKKRV